MPAEFSVARWLVKRMSNSPLHRYRNIPSNIRTSHNRSAVEMVKVCRNLETILSLLVVRSHAAPELAVKWGIGRLRKIS
jgi:hypothetical protein